MGVCVCVSVVYMFLRSTSEIATLYLTHRRRSEDGGIIHTYAYFTIAKPYNCAYSV